MSSVLTNDGTTNFRIKALQETARLTKFVQGCRPLRLTNALGVAQQLVPVIIDHRQRVVPWSPGCSQAATPPRARGSLSRVIQRDFNGLSPSGSKFLL